VDHLPRAPREDARPAGVRTTWPNENAVTPPATPLSGPCAAPCSRGRPCSASGREHTKPSGQQIIRPDSIKSVDPCGAGAYNRVGIRGSVWQAGESGAEETWIVDREKK
jgi:hypothetical protein